MKVKNLKCIASALVVVLTATFNAHAWDGTGHMLVAQVAYDRLNDKARARVDELAAKLLKTNDVPYNAVNIACWPDNIKAEDADPQFRGLYKPWHYIDIGCSTNDPDVLANPPALTPTNGDVIVALTHCVDLVKNKQTDALVPNGSVALAMIIHFVGDIHQPLHTTARYNPNPKPNDKYKHDAGGNGVTLVNIGDTQWGKNLHTFWDEAYRRYYEAGKVKATPALPETSTPGSPDMKEWMKRLPLDVPEKFDTSYDVKKWVMESHEIACTQVYCTLGIPYGIRNGELREDYVKQATNTARHQLVVAGYRLAALLNDLYGK
jgi:hypothetical protein